MQHGDSSEVFLYYLLIIYRSQNVDTIIDRSFKINKRNFNLDSALYSLTFIFTFDLLLSNNGRYDAPTEQFLIQILRITVATM